MDVQSDSADPAPGETQPSGKKKGFKLFGKRKPGSIFSIRGRGEEKDPAAAARGKTPDGSPESVSSDPEREPESAPGEGPAENGPPDAFLQDGEGMSMMAASPPRPSICSTGSVRSLGFLLRLRGGRKGGGGERQVQTVSQPPPGRQRRGIKGLFSNVKFPANKSQPEDKVEVPPSPLLMPSRSNSVEIIKEDMTLTPRPPRNHNSSSESEGPEPSSHVYGSTAAPRAPVSPGSAGSPAEPGDAGLSFLLADISSLLTFDSITTGGDIMADVAAEWDKASAALSARDTGETPATPSPRPARSPAVAYAPPAGAAASTRAPAPVLAGNPPRAFTASVKPAAAAAPSLFTQPGGAGEIKSYALSSQPFKSPPAVVSANPAASAGGFITLRSSSAATPSSTLVTLTSFSTPPVMTSTLMTTKPPAYHVPAAEPTPSNPPAPAVRPPYGAPPALSSAAARPTSGPAVPVRNPVRADPAPLPFAPVAHGLPSSFAPSDKPESRNVPGSQSSWATQPPHLLSGAPTGEARASVLAPCPVQARPPSSAPIVVPKTPAPLPTTPSPPLPAPAVTVAKPPCPPTRVTSAKSAPSSFAAPPVASAFSSAPTPVSSAKPPSIPAPVLAASQTPPATKPAAAAAAAAVPARLDKTPSVPASAPLPASQAAVPALTLSSTPRPSDPASAAPTLAVKTPPLPVPPPFFTPAPLTPAPSSVTPAPAPVSCSPASTPPTPPTPPTPSSVVTKPAPAAPTPVSIPVSLPKASPPTTAVAPGPGRPQAPVEPVPAGPAAVNDNKGAQKPSRREEAVPSAAESQQTSLPGPVKDRRTPPSKLTGLSKIPVVGGGRGGKPPLRDPHPPAHCGDEADRSPDPVTPGPTPAPTPASSPAATPEEQRPRLSPQDARGRVAPASRQPHHPEEQTQHPRAASAASAAGSLRDSKIPVKHGAQPASTPREPPRSKIPTSKVPVRRLGASKPVAANATALQMRK